MDILKWLDKEQEIKLQLESNEQHKNRTNHNKKLNNAIAKMDIEFVKLRNSGIKNLHPVMIERCKNII